MPQPKQTPKARKLQTQAAIIEVETVRLAVAIPSFDDLPDSAWIRQSQLVRDPKHPTRPTPLPISPATFWRWVRAGKFPKPTKLGSARVTAWKVGDVRAWIDAQPAAA
jgi:prophage regulatory protein